MINLNLNTEYKPAFRQTVIFQSLINSINAKWVPTIIKIYQTKEINEDKIMQKSIKIFFK